MKDCILFHLKPNGYGSSDFYAYDGNLSNLKEVSGGVKYISGWMAKFKSVYPKSKGIVAVFNKEGNVFVDYGYGPLNFTSGEVDIKWRKTLNILSGEFVATKAGARKRFLVYIPLTRILSNDGSFPDDVEPLYALLKRIKEEPETIEGISIEGE